MHLKSLLTTILWLTHIVAVFSQTSFPFDVQSENHSSYYGLVASVSIYTSIQNAASALKQEDVYTRLDANNHFTGQFTKKNDDFFTDIDTSTEPNESSDEEKIAVTIQFSDANYFCDNKLELTLGFETYTMNSDKLELSLSKGRYYYKIKGSLSCDATDGCQIDNTGIIDIENDGTFLLTWQVTEYQKCWITMRKAEYYTSVID